MSITWKVEYLCPIRGCLCIVDFMTKRGAFRFAAEMVDAAVVWAPGAR